MWGCLQRTSVLPCPLEPSWALNAFPNPCSCSRGTGLAFPDVQDPSDAAGRRPAGRGCIEQCTMSGDTAPFHGKLVSENRFAPIICGIIKPIKFY